MGSFSDNIGLSEPTPFDPAVANAWAPIVNTNMTLIDSAVAGIEALSVAGAANVVLTSNSGAPDQSRNQRFNFTGVLTGNIFVLWPPGMNRFFSVANNTTGAFTLGLGVDNGSGSPLGGTLNVPQGAIVNGFSDGTNIGSNGFSFVPGQIPGTTTNDNAAAGNVGEFIDAAAGLSPISTITGTPIVSISLTAGDWDVSGVAEFAPGATTIIFTLVAAISTLSGTVSGESLSESSYPPSATLSNAVLLPTGVQRISIATTTTVYLNAEAVFTTSTMTAGGVIRARRMR